MLTLIKFLKDTLLKEYDTGGVRKRSKCVFSLIKGQIQVLILCFTAIIAIAAALLGYLVPET